MAIHMQSRSYTWVFALLGVISILFGLAAIFWPGLTLRALVYLFGGFALVSGVLALIYTFEAISLHSTWWPSLVIAIVDVATAVIVFSYPDLTAVSLVYLIAGWAILAGLFEILIALVLARFLWLIAGVLSVVVGVVLLGNPHRGAVALVLVLGVFAIIWGILLLIEATTRPSFTEIHFS
jgi:uncharacterized membrane protein HdeD (DUF308 family)